MKTLKLFLVAVVAIGFGFSANAQSLDELKAMKAEKAALKAGIDEEIAGLDKQIKEFPGWTKGLGVTVGLNLGGFSDWYANDNDLVNSASSGFGIAGNAYANNNGDGSFWHNSANVSFTSTTTGLDKDGDGEIDRTEGSDERLNQEASLFTLNSLYGWELFSNIFASAEGRYETTLTSFNNPGKLTVSAGATWKPNNNLTVVVHPLAYQFNFPGAEYSSASGAKIGANYVGGEIYPGIKWTSELAAFLAYGGSDLPDDASGIYPANITELSAGDLSNWTWINNFAVADVFKGIGLGFSLGLRGDKALGFAKGVGEPGIQTFYTLGLTYAIAK